MVHRWSLDDARRSLESVVAAAQREGPQVIERQGERAVLVIEDCTSPGQPDAEGTDIRDVLLPRPAPEDCIDELDDLIGERSGLCFDREAGC